MTDSNNFDISSISLENISFESKKHGEIAIILEQLDAEFSLMEIYPSILAVCDVNKENQLQYWRGILIVLLNAFIDGGIVESQEVIDMLKQALAMFSEDYFIKVLMNFFIMNNYDFVANDLSSQQNYDNAREKNFYNIRNSAFKHIFKKSSCVINNKTVVLSNIENLTECFSMVEIYKLCYLVLKNRYANTIKKLIGNLQIKK